MNDLHLQQGPKVGDSVEITLLFKGLGFFYRFIIIFFFKEINQ